MTTLTDILQSFMERGQQPALVYRTGVRRFVVSYATLYDQSLKMAAYLELQGVTAGDRVLLWGPNGPTWLVAFWGIIASGAVVVPVDFMSGRDRAETIAGLAEVTCAIQSRAKLERLSISPTILLEDLDQCLAGVASRSVPVVASPADCAELIYTSGTTGNPKGVILSHRNLMANLAQVNRHLPVVTAEFCFLSLLPLSHMFEQMGGLLTPLANGATIVYLRTLKPTAIMSALAEESVTTVIAVPRLLQLLRGSIERELAGKGLAAIFSRLLALSPRLSPTLRRILFWPVRRVFGPRFAFFVSGGAPLAANLFRFWQALGFSVVEGYGLTECAPVLTANTLQHQTAGSVGVPLPGVEVRLAENEVQVKGENVFSGYFRNQSATAEAFTSDGWFRTGDLGQLAADGTLVIKGRAKEMIVTAAGVNVYPDELEDILVRTAGVREGCVIGLDRGQGDEVHAVIVPDESGRPLEGIIDEVNRQLDDLHRITGVSRWPDAELPKTTTLKVRKFMVKERLLTTRPGSEAMGAGDRLAMLIAQVLNCSPAEVQDEAFLVADLGLSSIGRLELVTALEQEYRIDLDDAQLGPQTRVADLRQLLARRDKVAPPRGLRRWAVSAPALLVRRLGDMLLHRPLLRSVVTLRPYGAAKLAGLSTPVVFVANHLSYLDQPCIMFSLPPELRYRTATAAWAEFFFVNFHTVLQRLWKRFTFEYGSVALSLFPLPQSTGFRSSLQHMGWLVDHGFSILVFPEGERSLHGDLLPFRQGLGIMVSELGIPVVPVCLAGLERVLPRGANWPRRGEVTVTFGEPLFFSGETPGEIVAMVRDAVAGLAEESGQ
ncbi:MAG TPA: AMP-binding protein [Geobacteraceae bacterium]